MCDCEWECAFVFVCELVRVGVEDGGGPWDATRAARAKPKRGDTMLLPRRQATEKDNILTDLIPDQLISGCVCVRCRQWPISNFGSYCCRSILTIMCQMPKINLTLGFTTRMQYAHRKSYVALCVLVLHRELFQNKYDIHLHADGRCGTTLSYF